MAQFERFIISTGRSGSTLLSNMVAENRRVLVLSEFMAGLEAISLPQGEVDGAEFASFLWHDDGLSYMLRLRSDAPMEMLSAGRSGGPVSPRTGGTPSLLRTAFPAMAPDDPEGLFFAAVEFAKRQKRRRTGVHLRALFEWLCERLGRDAWVERSGFGIRMFPWIREAFPSAQFLHLHRDGPEVALSMQNHPWFGIGIPFDFNPPEMADLVAAICNPSTAPDDYIMRLRRHPQPADLYGRHWSNMLCRAYRHLVKVPPERYSEMRFEDLGRDARTALADLAAFFQLPDDPGWIDRAAAMVEREVPSRLSLLSNEERLRLEAACLPGKILVGRADPSLLEVSLERIRSAYEQAHATML